MKISHRNFAVATLCSAAILLLGTLAACPFCLSPPQTFVEQISRADIVVIAELLRFRVLDDGTRPESTLRIREVLRGEGLSTSTPSLAIGHVVVVEKEAAGKTGDLFLMYGDLPVRAADSSSTQLTGADSSELSKSTFATVSPATFSSTTKSHASAAAASQLQPESSLPAFTDMPLPETRFTGKSSIAVSELISWNDVSQVSSETVEYLRRLPGKSVEHSERLRFYLTYLEHPEPMVAIDAWAEFGNSTYEQVRAVRKEMPRERLRAWIADPSTSPERLGLYGMMLGLCGESSDADFLLSQIFESPLPVIGEAMFCEQWSGIPGSALLRTIESTDPWAPKVQYGSEGLLGGYLLLAGEKGLDTLDQKFVNSQDIAYSYCQALQFVWTYEPTLIIPDRLRQSMRKLLDAEQIQSTAIINLCRWEDWSILPHLQSSFESIEDEASQRAVIEFSRVYLASIKKKQTDAAHKDASEAFLAKTRMNHPELFSSSSGVFGPPRR